MLRRNTKLMVDKVDYMRTGLEAAERETQRARSQYHAAVGDMARAGLTVREIGAQIGISHQRVQQILDELECIFCDAAKYDGAPFVGGGDAGYICVPCLELAELAIKHKRHVDDGDLRDMGYVKNGKHHCNFCRGTIGDKSELSGGKIDVMANKGKARVCRPCVRRFDDMVAAQNTMFRGRKPTI
jgi:hypothetical protein